MRGNVDRPVDSRAGLASRRAAETPARDREQLVDAPLIVRMLAVFAGDDT